AGMVVCPKGLLEELDRTRATAPEIGDLKVSGAAHVVFPYHRLLDTLEEEARGAGKLGTTSRGIGPAYQDKVARQGVRIAELVDPARLRRRLEEVLQAKNRQLSLYGQPLIEIGPLYDEYARYAERIAPMVADTDVLVQDAVRAGERVLFEGAQGTFLDLDSGTYPFVTSSHPTAGGACLGTGIGPRDIDGVLGVCKAYTTRVGAGPFPTELHDEVGEWIRKHGKEYGTVTGRGRRIGWLDLVVLRHACRLNSMSGLVVTRMDILSGFDSVQVATGYRLDGARIGHVPCDTEAFGRAEPEYVTMMGWKGDVRACRRLIDLPAEARAYLDFMEEATETPVAVVSVGPDRDETIVARPELLWPTAALTA
ncbi:MAG: adenylosuccinate synthase, partial [Fimbriimonas ginsengisoli]|nr:adenylosuccinate synthase [Fimbriimonas ginsengisoli]